MCSGSGDGESGMFTSLYSFDNLRFGPCSLACARKCQFGSLGGDTYTQPLRRAINHYNSYVAYSNSMYINVYKV
jgi:hypothetical protein